MQGHLERKSLKVSMIFFETVKSEDLDHITNLKRIIVAIVEYLKSEIVLEAKTDELFEHFRRFSKTLYISTFINNKNEDENEGQIGKESEIWFDYIFENEKYPR